MTRTHTFTALAAVIVTAATAAPAAAEGDPPRWIVAERSPAVTASNPTDVSETSSTRAGKTQVAHQDNSIQVKALAGLFRDSGERDQVTSRTKTADDVTF